MITETMPTVEVEVIETAVPEPILVDWFDQMCTELEAGHDVTMALKHLTTADLTALRGIFGTRISPNSVICNGKLQRRWLDVEVNGGRYVLTLSTLPTKDVEDPLGRVSQQLRACIDAEEGEARFGTEQHATDYLLSGGWKQFTDDREMVQMVSTIGLTDPCRPLPQDD